MTVRDIFDLAIKIGREADFRSKEEIDELLTRKRKQFEKLSEEDRQYFDQDLMENPYSDTRIHFVGGEREIKKIFAGIDISIGGLLLAKELGADLVINHHPIGRALATLGDVMDMQVELLEHYGIPVAIAEKTTHKRISEVTRGVNPANHNVVVDAAKLLRLNLINIHTPADNLVFDFIRRKIETANPRYVGDIINVLNGIPEYQEARRQGVGPILFVGSPEHRCGKVAITEITGGTEGSKEIYQAMANAGIGTIVGMHQSEEHRKNAEQAHVNVVIAGHISTDSIGMNLFLDQLENMGIEVVPFGGLIRIKR